MVFIKKFLWANYPKNWLLSLEKHEDLSRCLLMAYFVFKSGIISADYISKAFCFPDEFTIATTLPQG